MLRWFGRGGAAACTPAGKIDPPLGAECVHCKVAIVVTDDGWMIPRADGQGGVTYHDQCFLRSMGIMQYGQNINRPIARVRHDKLQRYDDGPFKSVCPVCKDGLLGVARTAAWRLSRYDRCVSCGQRFYYTDIDINGEPFHVPEAEVS